MSKQSLFFATKDDLLAVTERVESKLPIKYTRSGGVSELPPESFSSANQIPDFGIAICPSGGGCETFLVSDLDMVIRPRPIKTSFAIDQLYNPDTITLNPGGLWKGEILLSGNIGVAHKTEASERLMKYFRSAIKSKFTSVRACWVGPQALEMLKAGKRLTMAEQCPPEYDLKLEI